MRSLLVSTMVTTVLYRIMGSRSLVTAARTSASAFVTTRARRQQSLSTLSRTLSLGSRGVPASHSFVGFHSNTRLHQSSETPEPMSCLYQEWTVEQDKLLFDNRYESLPKLASLLGRGVKGVESRLAKLTDVNSPAYERLFAGSTDKQDTTNAKLVPAKEILRRIQYDPLLDEADFVVMHYNRVEDEIMESPMDAPNNAISSPETKFVLALPEHRVVAVRYKERVVWDRTKRIDRVFGSTTSETIADVIENYDTWKEERDKPMDWNNQRQAQVSARIQKTLGQARFDALKEASAKLQQVSNQEELPKLEVQSYIKLALQLFRDARQDPSIEPSLAPQTDLEALDAFSELVALLPDSTLRPAILEEIVLQMNRLEGKSKSSTQTRELPTLLEDDLTETFVRGSGAGGQKINKTANRVVLVHNPTSLKVECQDTRSLSQNRKLARKRLRLKLDEYLNGSESRTSIKHNKLKTKKSKTKARNRARQLKKKQQKQAAEEM